MTEVRGGQLELLRRLARRAMVERGLEPDFPPEAVRQVDALRGPAEERDQSVEDLRGLPWFSVDNEDSRDLDQLTAAESLAGGAVRVRVAVADVDALVAVATPVDAHARRNTTSVYTAGGIFPMLPEKLSTDLTSLNEAEDRLAVVISYVVDRDGAMAAPAVGRARVRNHARLSYPSVGAWLEGQAPPPEPLRAVAGLDAQVRLQDEAAQRLRGRRHEQGALELETLEPRAVVSGSQLTDLRAEEKNRAQELIEDLMIAANGSAAQFLAARSFPSLRRVVREPKRWPRIVALAASSGETLPDEPNAVALETFLLKRRKADPLRFPDLSLAVVKLLGRGEYVVERPGGESTGHFGLAARDYLHATAPNRRYPDLITHRLLKSALAGTAPAYAIDELSALAAHCTAQEDAAEKVERQVRKSAGALLLSRRVGQRFDAIVTGSSAKGTWVRVLRPPVEGKVVRGEEGLDVGDKVAVQLVDVDVERGYIDFIRAGD
ncbi:MAG TPA: RNB domain-containing ribonuclease [Vicinamibacteria bacterium]|nr:RNB domain-containing ribonuclease [Vicinamibacteria bacterium]